MGIVPLWGFQLLIAISSAIFFRLNKALVIIAANISIPPMIPLILYGSMLTGSLWVENPVYVPSAEGITLDFVRQTLFQYVTGAIVLALVTGLTGGIITYTLLRILKRKRSIQKTVDLRAK
jgi:uncharacterized protein (DUF2062 family)